MPNAIPSLDLSSFTGGTAIQKHQFVHDLGKAYSDTGFVSIYNHGFAAEQMHKTYHVVKQFFDLPSSTKKSYEIKGLAGQRGFVSFGSETAKGSQTADLKEFWHFGQYLKNKEDYAQYGYPENIEVKELKEFNTTGKTTYKTLENIGKQMLRAIALFLGLEEHFFDSKIEGGNSILRPIYYPSITEEPESAVRAAQHEDINLITLLMGASAGGLQILSKENQWVNVTAIEDHLVVNVGDMLQRLTNGILKSTTHRVVNPPKDQWQSPRYSIPFFLHPKADVSLASLPSCVGEDNPKKYPDCTAGEYLTERLIELGLLKP